MGVIIPDDIKVLSNEFKDFITDLATEVNRMSEAYSDLQRVRANTSGGGGGTGETSEATGLMFYVIPEDTPTAETLGDDDFNVPALAYSNGRVFQMDGLSPVLVASGVTGYDFGTVQNDPLTSPPQANILQGDRLESTTVVACTMVDPFTAVFSSVKPRLSVECDI